MRTAPSVGLIALCFALAGPALAGTFKPYKAAAFDAALQSGKPVIVHVHADWCVYCNRQMPILDALLKKPELGKASAFRVNYDTDREFLRRFGVRGQSTVLVFNGGKETARSAFVVDPAALSAQIFAGL